MYIQESLHSLSKKIAVITVISIIVTTIVMPSNFIVLGSPLKVALIVGGDETDLGFSYMAILGAQAIATEYPDWTVSISKLVSFVEQRAVAAQYGDEGYDLVYVVGGQFQVMMYGYDGLDPIPELYPNTFWVMIPGGGYSPFQNMAALGPTFQIVGHFLAGILVAEMTTTRNVGTVYGEYYPYTNMECNAFIAGVHSVDPSIVVYNREVGAWDDPSLGYSLAEALIVNHDVDIIVHVADYSGRGVISACVEYDIMVIGCVADQWELAPDNMLTSILMDIPRFMDMIVQCILGGGFLGYMSIEIDLSGLAPFHNLDPLVPQDVKDLLAASAALIKTDLNFDGKVNILDIATAAKAFGSYPGHGRWDPMVDVNGDNKIDIRDIARVAKNFGETFTPVPLDDSQPPEQSP
ncbi:MAG: BMP family ABC transporter substrate-binding protein [Candidatus Bathyarchaeota archaeon]|nr:BMP family ABC transporter substrate-binding protein [Candidatus Bathyarchaeota archaeon]MDH5746020.1 BMP family ABC transporter substrate-binding protein [Candidatus Bathyarchaeota archaeon]